MSELARAGLLLPATLAEHLGLEGLCDELVDLGGRRGGAAGAQGYDRGPRHARWRRLDRASARRARCSTTVVMAPSTGRREGSSTISAPV